MFRGNAAAGSLVEEEGPSGEEEEELRDPPPLLRAWLGPVDTLVEASVCRRGIPIHFVSLTASPCWTSLELTENRCAQLMVRQGR